MTVSVDPSSAALLSPEFLDHADGAGLLLPNADEARMLSGERDPEQAAQALATRFGEIVVTLGAEGALWTDGRASVRAAAVPVEAVVDSTGAGDAFAAGLLAARLEGAEPAEALAAGARLAATAVVRPGGGRRAPRSAAAAPPVGPRRGVAGVYGSGEGVAFRMPVIGLGRTDVLNAVVRP